MLYNTFFSVTEGYGQESRGKEVASGGLSGAAAAEPSYSHQQDVTTFAAVAPTATTSADQDDFNLSEFVSKSGVHDPEDPTIKLIQTTPTTSESIEKPTATICHLSVLQAPLTLQKESTEEKAQSINATFSLQ